MNVSVTWLDGHREEFPAVRVDSEKSQWVLTQEAGSKVIVDREPVRYIRLTGCRVSPTSFEEL